MAEVGIDDWDSNVLGLTVVRCTGDVPRTLEDVMATFQASLAVVRSPVPLGDLAGRYEALRCAPIGELEELVLVKTKDLVADSHDLLSVDAQDVDGLPVEDYEFGGRYDRDPATAPRSAAIYRQWLRDAAADPERHVYAMQDLSGVVAFSLPSQSPARLELIGVSRHTRGAGLGTRLFEGMLSELPPSAEVRIGVYSENEAAKRLYHKYGARPVGRTFLYHLWSLAR